MTNLDLLKGLQSDKKLFVASTNAEKASFNTLADILTAAPVGEFLGGLFLSAGINCKDSRAKRLQVVRELVLPLYPSLIVEGQKSCISFVPNKEKAFAVPEGCNLADIVKNYPISALKIEEGNASISEEDKRKRCYIYFEKAVEEWTKVDDNTKAKSQVIKKYYLCENGGKFNFSTLRDCLLVAVGYFAKVDQIKAEQAKLKAEQAERAQIKRYEDAQKRADALEAKAKEAAKKAKEEKEKASKK